MPQFALSKSILLASVLVLSISVPALPQPAEPQDQQPPNEGQGPTPEQAERLATLSGILRSISDIREDLNRLERDRGRASSEDEKASLSQEIEDRSERIGVLETDFARLATGIDRATFFTAAENTFVWQEELGALLAPVVTELKAATARPREIESLRSQVTLYENRLPNVETALGALEGLHGGTDDTEVKAELEELTDYWQQQYDQLSSQRDAAAQRLEEMEQEKVGLGDAAGELLRLFFKERGANLLFAVLAFVAIFLSLRYLHRLIHKFVPAFLEGSETRQLLFRLADVAYYVVTIAIATSALLAVLYLSSDWVLLTLALFVMLGLAWTARNALPLFLEQGRLLLNVGAVRDGERLVYLGIPWRVATLSFFTDLENPALRGGRIRLPLKDLVGMRSRPAVDDEPWFPSEMGHWVILEDGTYGEIVEQTPEVVIVSTTRGIYRSYSTVDYLAQHPKNLSVNFFAVPRVVGLDYKYRDIVNTEIVTKMKAAIEKGLREMFYGEHLVRVIVELKEMNASSLDVITIGRFKGAAASEWTEIGWKIQQLALECCNKNGWEIPFPQLTVHQAKADAESP